MSHILKYGIETYLKESVLQLNIQEIIFSRMSRSWLGYLLRCSRDWKTYASASTFLICQHVGETGENGFRSKGECVVAFFDWMENLKNFRMTEAFQLTNASP